MLSTLLMKRRLACEPLGHDGFLAGEHGMTLYVHSFCLLLQAVNARRALGSTIVCCLVAPGSSTCVLREIDNWSVQSSLGRQPCFMTSRSKVTLEEYVKAHGGSRVIRRILLANNGMAATKAILSMRNWAFMELGSHAELEIIVMASKDDLEANAEFIRLANAFVEVPGGKNSNNYANVSLICEIAQTQKVDAVWPGWGHASENPSLPRTLEKLGISFLGPGDTA
eukprot:652770-Amphidinium_carterae.1